MGKSESENFGALQLGTGALLLKVTTTNNSKSAIGNFLNPNRYFTILIIKIIFN